MLYTCNVFSSVPWPVSFRHRIVVYYGCWKESPFIWESKSIKGSLCQAWGRSGNNFVCLTFCHEFCLSSVWFPNWFGFIFSSILLKHNVSWTVEQTFKVCDQTTSLLPWYQRIVMLWWKGVMEHRIKTTGRVYKTNTVHYLSTGGVDCTRGLSRDWHSLEGGVCNNR